MQQGRVLKVNENQRVISGAYVFYWMQSAQRMKDNHALEVAIQLANQYEKPLVVAFVLMTDFPSANQRSFQFMLEGLEALFPKLHEWGADVRFYEGLNEAFYEDSKKAAAIVLDKGYGRFIKSLKEEYVKVQSVDVYEVDTNVVVPVHEAYPKEAYAAYALRPSLLKKMPAYAYGFDLTPLKIRSASLKIPIFARAILDEKLSHIPKLSPLAICGGEDPAQKLLKAFIETKLEAYDVEANDPSKALTSGLSPYLHFGQISPITIYEAVMKSGISAKGFMEQLVVRRELAYNFVAYNPQYDVSLEAILPNWAKDEMKSHGGDKRPYLYSLHDFETASTHDPYWNAAQIQMVKWGTMHNYMRMYWGKKVIEWTDSYEEAFQTLIYLNDKYQLDGRDPNGYAGIAWCFGKHDRPFFEREIFGKIRYMNAAGLKKKFDMDAYVKSVMGDL